MLILRKGINSAMQFIQADVLFPVYKDPISNGILVVDSHGTICDIIDPTTTHSLPDNVEKLNGFLCPGFVNTHCHLELSHLKNQFDQKKGLIGFIDQMRLNRGGENILEAMKLADEEMEKSGIVAVGDISNNDLSIQIKNHSKIYYHTFVEIFDVVKERSEKAMENGVEMLNKFLSNNLVATLAPHAPYTVTSELMSVLSKHYFEKKSIATIHNQETSDEDKMFQNKSGVVYDFLFSLNPAIQHRQTNFKSSLFYTLGHLKNFEKLLLVHNTFTNHEQIVEAENYSKNLYWCLCVNANLYIEDKLPNVDSLMKEKCKITIGTDSYASNHSLSILDELKTISFHFPHISFHEILKWATINGAEFLGKDTILGTFEKGKKPGIVLIENVGKNDNSINKNSISKIIRTNKK